jgi:hypothetical protein
MLTTSSLFCNSGLLLSVHAWLHLLSLSIYSSSILLMLLGSHTVCCFHHFCSVQLMFFISASFTLCSCSLLDYIQFNLFYRETTTSLCHDIFLLFLLSSSVTLCISNAQVENLKNSGIMIPMLRNNDSVSVTES